MAQLALRNSDMNYVVWFLVAFIAWIGLEYLFWYVGGKGN